MFQVWACKQVMGIAGTMEWDKNTVRKCPSCLQERDTCVHVLDCEHSKRVETLRHTINLMEVWLEEANTNPDLLDCIAEYAWARGGQTMMEICAGLGDDYQQMARDQDTIGWQRFMEGMISSHMRRIQSQYHHRVGTRLTPVRWAKGARGHPRPVAL